jgi:cardiolipin synthase A/B
VDGNAIRLQFDGPYTFDAWIEAIDGARDYIHFENYIIRDDRVGRVFRDALVSKALQGVEVRVLYDWIGCWATRRRYWKPYREAGVEVRAFNPPSLRDPFGMLQRDHRKMVCVDGTLAFIGGFCVGKEWAGDGEHPPWRDTGVEIEGPAAAVCSRAFERIWGQVGEPVPVGIQSDPSRIQPAGETPVWIIEGEPWRSRVYRETQLVAASAQERIWITDPYFVAPFPVAEALTAAARDGVDVRVLLPAHNNWPWVGSLSRGGYRGLLEAGVRIFEWQGPMIHAKTMVADGVWSRIGSSNLNSASLLGNWEIDAGVLDEPLAVQMEGLFLADLTSAVEIVLPRSMAAVPGTPGGPEVPEGAGVSPPKTVLDPGRTLHERLERLRKGTQGPTRWGVPELLRAGSSLGDALAGHRTLGKEDRTVLGTAAALVLAVAGLAAFFPRLVGWSIAAVAGWFGVVLAVRSVIQARQARRERDLVEVGGERTAEQGGPGEPGEPERHLSGEDSPGPLEERSPELAGEPGSEG